MLLWSCLLLVPAILATKISEVQIQNYVLRIKDNFPITLESIEVIGEPSEELNLSGLKLDNIEDIAFENVSHIKNLNLSNNQLTYLSKNTLASLTYLEQLDVSNNNLLEITKPFVSLGNLKVLDLSNNRIKKFGATDFFGLTKSCVIFLNGTMHIDTMSTELFENNSRTVKSFKEDYHQVNDIHRFSYKDTYYRTTSFHIKICIIELDFKFRNTKLISAERYIEEEELRWGCFIIKYRGNGVLSLGRLRIAKFQKGWYKIRDSSIHSIDLNSNHITDLTSEMLNDLPESISTVNFKNNYIKRLKKGVIVNQHLREIHFSNNYIDEIKDEVFINTNLTTLNLSHNKLRDTTFAATLPSTLTKIELDYNIIFKIVRESFSKLNKLEVLVLSENRIKEIHRGSLRGLSNLKHLNLTVNDLDKIEAGSFKDLTALEILDLKFNFITELESFADLKNIKKIFLGCNELGKRSRDSLFNFSDSLEVLDLEFNDLKNLKAGTFVNLPKYELILNNNSIENIEDETFNSPYLQILNLANNHLSVIDSGKLKGLKNLQSLRLENNNIKKIEKGAFGNLRSLCKLFMSHNPIKRLENGTLYGLLQEEGCYVKLKSVPIELIHGGVFDSSVDSSFDRLSESDTPKLINL